ncbi:hypothetical protein SCOCK_290093 [Actinacidiphila cocklensis]|uniref:Uncharacterized protein n=1 Tax=Actinacidiphila cocklensis TaxID=887465 RepID=A0A9W4GTK8_9ACTN|nr:hypothetical protein SCOCK_290093 [Actinacidiphila cocklensis]
MHMTEGRGWVISFPNGSHRR